MKNFFIGLLLGILIIGVAGYFEMVNMKKVSYDSGFDAGNKKGVATGTADGITQGIVQGITQIKAQQKQYNDSVATVEKAQQALASKRAAALRRKTIVRPIQNWHVINGKIAEPIPDTTR